RRMTVAGRRIGCRRRRRRFRWVYGHQVRQGLDERRLVLGWLKTNEPALIKSLADLVAIRSISTDGEHQKEIDDSAALTCEQMRQAGLQNVELLRSGNSNPYAYGEWLGAPGKPTVFLYAHHDVQP